MEVVVCVVVGCCTPSHVSFFGLLLMQLTLPHGDLSVLCNYQVVSSHTCEVLCSELGSVLPASVSGLAV